MGANGRSEYVALLFSRRSDIAWRELSTIIGVPKVERYMTGPVVHSTLRVSSYVVQCAKRILTVNPRPLGERKPRMLFGELLRVSNDRQASGTGRSGQLSRIPDVDVN